MATFIQSKQAFRFKVGTDEFTIPTKYVGSVPDWVTNTTLFKLAVSDGSITYVGQPPVAVTVTKTPEELAAEAEQIAADAKAAADAQSAGEATKKGKA
jgi:hypothetical protein